MKCLLRDLSRQGANSASPAPTTWRTKARAAGSRRPLPAACRRPGSRSPRGPAGGAL